MGFSHWELIVVLLVVLLLFGKRLPGAMRSVGQSITEFKKGTHDANEDSERDQDSVN